MPNHAQIYKSQAEQYDDMISKQLSLLPVIEEIVPVTGSDIVDLGAGTGRLAVTLSTLAKSIVALDSSAEMLALTEKKLTDLDVTNWRTAVADHREIPLDNDCADIVISGWSISYLTNSKVKDHELNLLKIMSEIDRVLRSGGTAIIFETMGTGFETPNPPIFLTEYYTKLDEEYHFNHQWIRTDYEFSSIEEAEQTARFFFGEALAERVLRENLIRLSECAGVWWKQKLI